MKRIKRSFWVWCFGLFLVCGLSAQETSGDTLRVSLLTCSPGTEIYELFGHTALRVQDSAKGLDLVFNYGMFDYNAPFFIWRYVKGETDYELGVEPFDYFVSSYSRRNSAVSEQVLNLTKEEKYALLEELTLNYRPENRVYRYNFFFDNCATRPRVKIEKVIDGIIKYDGNVDIETFRSIIHKYTGRNPWAQFGIDLCLGSDADREASPLEKLFVPSYLHDAFKRALIVPKEGDFKDLVIQDNQLIASVGGEKSQYTGITPTECGLLLLLIVMGVSIYGVIRGYSFWGLDIVLFGAAGIIGLVLTFLAVFSEHPAVGSNWNLCVFQPFHLLFLPFYVIHARKREKDYYHVANFIVLTLFMIFMGVLPQKINPAVLPLALCLWVRSGCYTLLTIDKWR